MALNAYLELVAATQGPIDGGITLAGREGTIEVHGMSHSVVSARDPASGLATGRRQHKALTISKAIDRASPPLMMMLANNENITRFRLRMFEPSATGRELNFYTIELMDAQVVDVRTEMLNNKYPENLPLAPREHISFVYGQIQWTYEDGMITASDSWESPRA